MTLVLVVLAMPGAAFAVDGVILVNQAKAMAGNVTPGDAPGFPVTFTQGGSYRLSSNLTAPAGVAAGVQINADDVTIDLNGFAIMAAIVGQTEIHTRSSAACRPKGRFSSPAPAW